MKSSSNNWSYNKLSCMIVCSNNSFNKNIGYGMHMFWNLKFFFKLWVLNWILIMLEWRHMACGQPSKIYRVSYFRCVMFIQGDLWIQLLMLLSFTFQDRMFWKTSIHFGKFNYILNVFFPLLIHLKDAYWQLSKLLTTFLTTCNM